MSSKFNSSSSSNFKSDSYLDKLANLSDVDNVDKSLQNLGILTQPVYITDAFLKTQNLSEGNPQLMRQALGFQSSVLNDLVSLKNNQPIQTQSILDNKNDIDALTTLTNQQTATLNTHTSQINGHTNQINGHTATLADHDTKFSENDSLWLTAIAHFDNILPKIPNIQLHTTQIADIVNVNAQQQIDIKQSISDIKILQASDIGDLSTLQGIVDDHTADITVINNTLVQYENRIDTVENAPPNEYNDAKLIADIKINTDDIISINTSIGTINTSIGTINTKNDDQDSKISTLQDENKTQTTSISNNTNAITQNTNDIAALENLQPSYYKLDGSRQMSGDLIFNGGTRFIRSIDKNMISLNYSDGSIAISSLNNGLVRSIAGRLINSQLSANDIDPISIADSKLIENYYKTDGTKQLTGNLAFNNTEKNINAFSILNIFANGSNPGKIKITGSGIELNGSINVNATDGLNLYKFPLTQVGENKIMISDANKQFNFIDYTPVDLSNTITKSGNPGSLLIGNTTADNFSLIQNNSVFLTKSNTNLTITSPEIILNNYTMPATVGITGQILKLNGSQLQFQDEQKNVSNDYSNQYYDLNKIDINNGPLDYETGNPVTLAVSNYPIFNGTITKNVYSTGLIQSNNTIKNISGVVKYFTGNITFTHSYQLLSPLTQLRIAFTVNNIELTGSFIFTPYSFNNVNFIVVRTVNESKITLNPNDELGVCVRTTLEPSYTSRFDRLDILLKEIVYIPNLVIGYDTNAYKMPATTENVEDISLLVYSSQLKALTFQSSRGAWAESYSLSVGLTPINVVDVWYDVVWGTQVIDTNSYKFTLGSDGALVFDVNGELTNRRLHCSVSFSISGLSNGKINFDVCISVNGTQIPGSVMSLVVNDAGFYESGSINKILTLNSSDQVRFQVKNLTNLVDVNIKNINIFLVSMMSLR